MFQIKSGDTRPAYLTDLTDDFGDPGAAPIDLTLATEVNFLMRLHGSTGSPEIRSPMTIADAVNGTVQYAWQAGDTDTPGDYDVEFEITWSDGGIETVPNDSYNTVRVVDDLD